MLYWFEVRYNSQVSRHLVFCLIFSKEAYNYEKKGIFLQGPAHVYLKDNVVISKLQKCNCREHRNSDFERVCALHNRMIYCCGHVIYIVPMNENLKPV